MERIVILANRLAESVLMNWDEEEIVKLAKEVAVACKENIDFTCLVKRMRVAQNRIDMLASGEDVDFVDMLFVEQRELEREVDEYLKKMES